MLNERERRILDAIERSLGQDDPGLRERLAATERRRRTPSWQTAAAALGVVIALCLVVLGLVGHAVALVVVAAGPWALRRWRTRTRTEPPASGGASS